jgi:hypothetical protein
MEPALHQRVRRRAAPARGARPPGLRGRAVLVPVRREPWARSARRVVRAGRRPGVALPRLLAGGGRGRGADRREAAGVAAPAVAADHQTRTLLTHRPRRGGRLARWKLGPDRLSWTARLPPAAGGRCARVPDAIALGPGGGNASRCIRAAGSMAGDWMRGRRGARGGADLSTKRPRVVHGRHRRRAPDLAPAVVSLPGSVAHSTRDQTAPTRWRVATARRLLALTGRARARVADRARAPHRRRDRGPRQSAARPAGCDADRCPGSGRRERSPPASRRSRSQTWRA